MDHPAANKRQMSCPVWAGQANWTSDPSQAAPVNPLPIPQQQQMGLASPVDSRSVYNQLQASSLSSHSHLPCTGDSHSTSLYKTPQLSSCSSSASLFVSAPAIPSISNVFSLAQLSQQPLMHTSNHRKNRAQVPVYQATHNFAPFQPLLNNQSLQNAAHDILVNLPSCSQSQELVSKSTGVDNAIAIYANSPTVPSLEVPEWTQPCRMDKAKSSDEQEAQRRETISLVSNETRSLLLQQREELLKKLSDLDELLRTMPSEDTPGKDASLSAVPVPVSNDPVPQILPDEPSECPAGEQVESEEEGGSPMSPVSNDSSVTEESSLDETSQSKSSPRSRMQAKQNVLTSATGRQTRSSERQTRSSERQTTSTESQTTSTESQTRSTENQTRSTENQTRSTESQTRSAESQTRTLKRKRIQSQSESSILVLQCVSKRGKRVYDKKNYCFFCSKPFCKLSRHLAMVHGDEDEVAAAFQHPKHSKERFKIWNRLKNKGNFLHNKNVLKTGKGFLAAVKRPKIPVQDHEFVHCMYCQGLYFSKGLFRHMKKCPEKIKNENEPKVGKKRLAFRCVLETLVPDISEGLKSLLSPMLNDPVNKTILNHKVILQFAEGMFMAHGSDPTRHENIRQNLRQIARLVLEAQKRTPLKEMEDFFVPSNFKHVVSAVNVLAGYNSKTNKYSRPSLAIKLGYQLQKLCLIVESNAIESGDESRAMSAQSFLEVYKKEWNKHVSAGALRTLRETKLVKEKSVPSIENVKLLNSHLINAHTSAEKKFRENVSAETYAALAKAILGRVILFNRRKPGEVSDLKLKEFLSRKVHDSSHYGRTSLSDLERTMCRFFTRIEIRGTCGRIVPVLLKQSFVLCLELLVKSRDKCGVPAENEFLFARPCALSAYSGSTVLRNYVKECGVESPETLTTAKIRMHFSTMLQMLNLDENEANQILAPSHQILQSTRSDVSDLHDALQETGSQTSAQWGQLQFSCNYIRPAAFFPDQSRPVQIPAQSRPVQKSTSTKSKPPKAQKNSKQKWDEAEVRAVERHMMCFIQGHKVPQKLDCIQCLEAEPEALRTRAWKGVKDYVRNRITALKREENRSALKNLPQTNWTSQDTSEGYYQQL